MPPKNKFSKEQIVDVAFAIAREEGMDSITIRKIADQLGSSIAPIYVNFKDVEELKNEVVNKIYEISNAMLQEQSTDNPFFDIGVASIRFAKEYNVLYKDLMFKNTGYLKGYDQGLGNNVLESTMTDSDLKDFTEDEVKKLLFIMEAFQMGLSVMASNGMHEMEDEELYKLLSETGDDVIQGMKSRKK